MFTLCNATQISLLQFESFNVLPSHAEKEISHRATALRCPETIITRGLRYECGFVSATYGRGTRATTLRTLRAGQEGGGSNNSPSVPPRRINCTKLWRDVTSRKWPDRKISLSLSSSSPSLFWHVTPKDSLDDRTSRRL